MSRINNKEGSFSDVLIQKMITKHLDIIIIRPCDQASWSNNKHFLTVIKIYNKTMETLNVLDVHLPQSGVLLLMHEKPFNGNTYRSYLYFVSSVNYNGNTASKRIKISHLSNMQ